jgi:hydrogenase maturation protein HypF
MLEHGWLDRTVLGVVFDGTGWGPDGTIWGGEFLLASTENFQRVGSLRPFLLPSGEQAIRQPWRIAFTLFAEACGVEQAIQALSRIVEPAQLQSLLPLIRRQIGPQTSSVGRLFDAISSLVLDVNESTYEGEPAARLEAVCDPATTGEYPFPLCESADGLQLDWRPLLQDLCDDLASGIPAGTMAMKFHRAVAAAVAQVATRYPEYCVVLSGGCFQNRILTELIAERLSPHPRPVGLPGVIPPNDGGLAAGQLAIALARLRQSSNGRNEISCV